MGSSILTIASILEDLNQSQARASNNIVVVFGEVEAALTAVGELVTGEGALEVTAQQKATLKALLETKLAAIREIATILKVTLPE